jgi:1-acyl-sn-glycerol-3-phosphate acyltransferase
MRQPAAAPGTFVYRPMEDLELPLAARLGHYPREPDIALDLLRAFGRRVAAALVKAQFHIQVRGTVPDVPRLALIPNHQSHLDTLAILAVLPDRFRGRIAVLAARDYFFERWPRAVAAGLFGQGVSFDRHRLADLRRWTRILQAQDRGWFLAYPSGSRRSHDLHAGLLLVLARSGWPIVPVALSGMAEAWPVGGLWRPFRTIGVRFGEPIQGEATKVLLDRLQGFWKEAGIT